MAYRHAVAALQCAPLSGHSKASSRVTAGHTCQVTLPARCRQRCRSSARNTHRYTPWRSSAGHMYVRVGVVWTDHYRNCQLTVSMPLRLWRQCHCPAVAQATVRATCDLRYQLNQCQQGVCLQMASILHSTVLMPCSTQLPGLLQATAPGLLQSQSGLWKAQLGPQTPDNKGIRLCAWQPHLCKRGLNTPTHGRAPYKP